MNPANVWKGKLEVARFCHIKTYTGSVAYNIPLDLQSPPSFEMQFQLDWQEWRPQR